MGNETQNEERPKTVALVGNPNCGKSTLFNALTGSRQKVGNYPGVTVSRKTGQFFNAHGKEVRAVDLPGSYSLSPKAPDEQITHDVLHGTQAGEPVPDIVLCVVDASALERHIPLVTEVADLGLPVVVALNMVDRAESAGIRLDPELLSEKLGVLVIPCQANKGAGILEIKHALDQAKAAPEEKPWAADGDENSSRARFAFAKEVCEVAARRTSDGAVQLSDKLDKILLHSFGGWVFFLSVMFLTFWSIFSWAETPMGWVEDSFAWLKDTVGGFLGEGDFRDLVVDGIIEGVGAVIIFLPQIIILFLLIGLLESTGYMARAAYLMDGPMSKAGLSGRSFIPLLSSYACAIPGIMSARTIEAPRGRLITILIAPWMSCTARLPVYALMIALLFPGGGLTRPLMLFGLYFLGTITALIAARLLRTKYGPDQNSHFLLELPPYSAPDLKFVLRHTGDRAWAFVRKAGTLILGLSILIWAAKTYPRSESEDPAVQLEESAMGKAGQLIEPVVTPLGWDWRIGSGVVMSFAAREVFASTMGIIFVSDEEAELERVQERTAAAVRKDGTPLFTPLTVISLLVFFVYALQCLPTTAVVRRETNSWKIALAQFFGMSLFAYLAALAVFQVGSLLGFT